MSQPTSPELTARIYRDMLYKTMLGEKFPVCTGAAFGTWINKAADLRMNNTRIEAFNGYTWQRISNSTLRIWLRRARQQRKGRTIRPAFTHSFAQ